MKKIFVTFTLLSALITFSYYYGKFVFVSMITRHGDKSILTNIQNANYKWRTQLAVRTYYYWNESRV